MKRIQPAGCGYISGYTCQGLPPITSDFRSGSTAIPMPIVSGGTVFSDKSAIPQQLEGFVMTLSPVIDMNTLELEIPELECRTEFDPFEVSDEAVYKNEGTDYTGLESNKYDGFLDFYSNGGAIGIPVTSDSIPYKEAVYIKVDGATTPVYVPGSDNPYILGGTWTFTDTQVVGPGILEPMVDTDFSPITIDTIPPPDAYFDTTTYLFDIFDAWRALVDARLNDLHDYVVPFDYSDMNGLLNLEVAKNLEGSCANFQIKMINSGGIPLAPTSEFLHSSSLNPIYQITGGTVVVNGNTVAVNSHISSEYEPPFHAYLDIVSSGDDLRGKVVVPNGPYSPASGHTTVYIGGVTAVNNALSGTVKDIASRLLGEGTPFTEYEIIQGDCITDVDLITGQSNGYVYMTVANGGRQYITDPLLNKSEFESLDSSNWSRGVQASAISAYIASHGGGGGSGSSDYAGPFKIAPSAIGGFVVNGVTPCEESDYAMQSACAESSYAGMVYFGAASSYNAFGGLIKLTQSMTTPVDIDVFAHIWLRRGGSQTATTTTALDGIDALYMDYNNTTSKNYPDEYVVRLGAITGATVASAPDGAATTYYVTGGTAVQIQSGDIYLYDNKYRGPFAVSVADNTVYVTCDDCPMEGTTSIAGYYTVNGASATPVGEMSLPLAPDMKYVYITFGPSDPVLSSGPSTEPNKYNVLLARIANGEAAQLHYGDIYVDGRWS